MLKQWKYYILLEAATQWYSGLQLYQKRDSGASVSLWILQNFWKHFFLQNASGGCFSFVALKFYVFLVEAFQFSENVDKLDSGTFKRGFTMTFMVKKS